jgi:hypothetical protein
MIRWIIDWWKKRKAEVLREWAHVPNPEWAAKRGGREYW